jgi:SAM-dependent methyltransferase
VAAFTCNVCGAYTEADDFATEPASCPCGSNVRMRALVYLLSMELFGRSIPLPRFPKLKAVRGLGMTDQKCYAEILAEKFDYTNTFYDREPRFDFSERHPELAGSYDFVLSSEVLEHIAPPVERALEEVCRLLKPNGFMAVTVYCNPTDEYREHFPDLNEYRIVRLGRSDVVVNRRSDGTLEAREDVVLHGGSGATLEMREFGVTGLCDRLAAAGFRSVYCLSEALPEIGVYFDYDVSQPLVARKERYVLNAAAQAQLVDLWRAAEDRLAAHSALAEHSRWMRLGRLLGLGPKFPG